MVKKVKEMVAWELSNRKETRDDDFLLVMRIYSDFYKVEWTPFYEVMLNHAELNLPSFESIRRMRQKLQEEMPLVYGASGQARRIRKAEEETYRREFANG